MKYLNSYKIFENINKDLLKTQVVKNKFFKSIKDNDLDMFIKIINKYIVKNDLHEITWDIGEHVVDVQDNDVVRYILNDDKNGDLLRETSYIVLYNMKDELRDIFNNKDIHLNTENGGEYHIHDEDGSHKLNFAIGENPNRGLCNDRKLHIYDYNTNTFITYDLPEFNNIKEFEEWMKTDMVKIILKEWDEIH